MVNFAFIRQETPSISFFFARLGVFLEFSGGHRPQVGLFLPLDCGAFRPVLTSLFPLILRSFISRHLEMTVIKYRDTDVRFSELETDLSSSSESSDKDFEVVMPKPSSSSKLHSSSKPSSSSSSIPFHALSKSCFLEERHLKSIRKRFKFPVGVVTRLLHPNEKLVPLPWWGEFLWSYLFIWPSLSCSSFYHATPLCSQYCTWLTCL